MLYLLTATIAISAYFIVTRLDAISRQLSTIQARQESLAERQLTFDSLDAVESQLRNIRSALDAMDRSPPEHFDYMDD